MTPVSFIWRIPTRVTLLTQVKHERADWNYCLTYLYCRWKWWFIGLESRESRESNVQWSIRIQNQISAPPKRDGHFGSFAVPLSFQRNGNTLGRVWLHKCFTYANASIISWILHSNASPKAISYFKDRKCIQTGTKTFAEKNGRHSEQGGEKWSEEEEPIWELRFCPDTWRKLTLQNWPITCRLKLIIIGQLRNSQRGRFMLYHFQTHAYI